MTVSSLEAVLAYVGSTGSTAISVSTTTSKPITFTHNSSQFILPGLFYYKISSPDSPLHQRLMKEQDDWDSDSDNDNDNEDDSTLPHRRPSVEPQHSNTGNDNGNDGLLAHSMLSTVGTSTVNILGRSKKWRRKLLRRLALALSIYGFVVMITCLITNTYFVAAH